MGEEAGAHALVVVCKGKRSKRQRVHAAAPPSVIMASAEVEQEDAASGCVAKEEEDMALCLMLLARGSRAGPPSPPSSLVVAPDAAADSTAKEGKFRSRRPGPANGDHGEFVFECRTCGRRFPSFQALGGHRTSHKKPRLLPSTPTITTTTSDEKWQTPSSAVHEIADPPVLAIPATPPKHEGLATATGCASRQHQQQGQGRTHECGVCGAEFASGQALGGHMRRHRPLVPASSASVVIGGKEKQSLLELDLNMPAHCDDDADDTTTASFATLLPAPALVDCLHY